MANNHEFDINLHVREGDYLAVTFGKKARYELTLVDGEITLRDRKTNAFWGSIVFQGSFKDFAKALEETLQDEDVKAE